MDFFIMDKKLAWRRTAKVRVIQVLVCSGKGMEEMLQKLRPLSKGLDWEGLGESGK